MVPRVVLKPRHARPFFAGHPWVYAGSIARVEGDPARGAEVRFESAEGVFIARGLWNPDSLIRGRLYAWDDQPLDDAFFRARIERAVDLRRQLPGADATNARRIVYSEGDGLSGLIADQYDRWLVVQITSRALWDRSAALLATLLDVTGCLGGLCRFDAAVAQREGVTDAPGLTVGTMPAGPIEVDEGGARFLLHMGEGQKTGFYLDQSVNRRAVAAYATGRRVLDLYCYSGGFGVHALRAGARSVLGVDSSERAIALARDNAELNHLANVEFRVDDVGRACRQLQSEGRRFDLVICDPPKFARSARDLDAALKAYVRVNRAAVGVLEPGGVLVSCSCSGQVDPLIFRNLLGQVGALCGRVIQVLEMRGQAPDHPVAAACPETEYLKCAICRVT